MKINVLYCENIKNDLIDNFGYDEYGAESFIDGIKSRCKTSIKATCNKTIDAFVITEEELKEWKLIKYEPYELTEFIEMSYSSDDYAIIDGIENIYINEICDYIFTEILNNNIDIIGFIVLNYFTKDVIETHFKDLLNFSVKKIIQDKITDIQYKINNNMLDVNWTM